MLYSTPVQPTTDTLNNCIITGAPRKDHEAALSEVDLYVEITCLSASTL